MTVDQEIKGKFVDDRWKIVDDRSAVIVHFDEYDLLIEGIAVQVDDPESYSGKMMVVQMLPSRWVNAEEAYRHYKPDSSNG